MAVKIVTDSCADLPPDIAEALGITIVPVYICFNDRIYRDGVDISAEELYPKLEEETDYPTTTQPMPRDFANVYQKLGKEAEGIVSIHLPARLSGTYNSALQGKVLAKTKCDIEVIDSLSVSMGLGLVVMAAARVALAGGSFLQVIRETKRIIPKIHVLGMMNSVKYIVAGGRISKTKATIGSTLSVKPLLALKNGEVFQVAMVRSCAKGLEHQVEFVEKTCDVREAAIVHNTTPDEVNALKKRIRCFVPEERIYVARLSASLGVHCGPGTTITAVRCA